MIDNFIVQTFGVSPMTFAIVVVFWAFVFAMFFGEGMAATFATCIFASITAWLIGKIGAVVFILLVVAIIVGAISFLFRDGGRTTVPSYKPIAGSTTTSATSQAYQQAPKLAPAVLFHGTTTMEAATDILNRNRWLIKSHYPQGVYLSDDFNTASTYAGFKGAIVEVNSYIASHMIVEYFQTTLTSDQLLAQGFRLIRNGKIFIAPTPKNTNCRYFRIEGLLPNRILDKNGNPISINF